MALRVPVPASGGHSPGSAFWDACKRKSHKRPPFRRTVDHQRIDAIVLEAVDRLFRNYGRLTPFVKSTPGLRDHIVDSPPARVVTNG